MRRDNYKLCTMHNLYCEKKKSHARTLSRMHTLSYFFLEAKSREKLQGATTVIIYSAAMLSFFFPECKELYMPAY